MNIPIYIVNNLRSFFKKLFSYMCVPPLCLLYYQYGYVDGVCERYRNGVLVYDCVLFNKTETLSI